ncbi:glucocorticoid modulatory element-binding protein 1-like [Poecilia formosa]|uniref:Glucocorticoid modulatory element-binding protein 1-like n=1 Tax=Poecilia formosa TaxID=48698 RepID=A0A096LYQ4_POEFO|nr:PREDICTED: glucocorticoid modulatory element-binding protein 1-like [Poecilia formosa]XP_016523224.1 PREDICTED: glucocorticoid modulatory element-binding protein 1-like [Poecilia formosa]
MAAAEWVSEPSGKVMVVKTEKQECRDNIHQRQIILQLNGLNGDSVGTATRVLAIETHQSDCEADGTEIEYGYPITCGDSAAVLLFKKFVCPGINVRCVKFNDQLISPKQFVHLAGKATLKDWKRAIRVGGVMLRKMMDSGQIDFYQHESVCSNTCRSTKLDVLMNNTRPPPGALVQPSLSCLALEPVGGQLATVTGEAGNAVELEESLEEMVGAASEQSNGSTQLVNSTNNGHPANIKRADSLGGVMRLWRGVAESGLMVDVLSGLHAKLVNTLKGVELRSENGSLQETDAHILNSLCEMFGLLDSVKQALDLRCTQNQESKIHHVLDEISEERRKQSCNQRKSYKTSSLKHLRPHRQSQQKRRVHDWLLNERTNTVIRPLSFTGLSAASHAQVFSHFSAPAGWSHLVGAGRTDGVGQSGNGKKDTSGQNKEMKQKTVHLPGDGPIRCDEAGKTKSSHGRENVK